MSRTPSGSACSMRLPRPRTANMTVGHSSASSLVMDPVRFVSPADFEERRALVNERLLFFRVPSLGGRPDRACQGGDTVAEAQQRADDIRAELARRGVHPDVLRFCRAELLERNYFHAVLEASKSVEEKLRTLTGLSGDGAPLVDATCSISSGPAWHSTALLRIGSAQSRRVSRHS